MKSNIIKNEIPSVLVGKNYKKARTKTFFSFLIALFILSLSFNVVIASLPSYRLEYIDNLIENNLALNDNSKILSNFLDAEDITKDRVEDIRLTSDEINSIAENIRREILSLEGFLKYPEKSKIKIQKTMEEIVKEVDKCYLLLESKDDLVHAILSIRSEEGLEIANNIHDFYHKTVRSVEDLSTYNQEFAKSIGIEIPQSKINTVFIPEQYIQTRDDKGNINVLLAEDVCNQAHGHVCVCGATSFRVTQAAISQLCDEAIFRKGDLQVIYHHPGKGHKDVFEYLLGTENVSYVKCGDSKHLTLKDHYTYTFIHSNTGKIWETTMKEGVIPDRFFEYRYEVKGFLNGWHQKKPNEVKKSIYEKMMNDAVCNILSMKIDEVFESVD